MRYIGCQLQHGPHTPVTSEGPRISVVGLAHAPPAKICSNVYSRLLHACKTHDHLSEAAVCTSVSTYYSMFCWKPFKQRLQTADCRFQADQKPWGRQPSFPRSMQCYICTGNDTPYTTISDIMKGRRGPLNHTCRGVRRPIMPPANSSTDWPTRHPDTALTAKQVDTIGLPAVACRTMQHLKMLMLQNLREDPPGGTMKRQEGPPCLAYL